VAYNTKLQTPVTEVFSGKEDAASVNEATFALVVEAGIVIVLELNAGLKLVNNVPVKGVFT
jgi:hypothetical protein